MRAASKLGMAIMFAAILAACGGRDEASSASPGALLPPTPEQLAYATYRGIGEQPVTLNAGVFEGEPFVEGGASRLRVELIEGLSFTADLDGDGVEEAVALLAESSGGSGQRIYLAAMKREPGRAVNVGTALVGDRVKVRAMSFAEGRVRLEVLQAGDGDAMSSPGELATREWELRDGALEEVSSEVTGRL